MPDVTVNFFAPGNPHPGQRLVLDALKTHKRVLLRAGRKWRKTSLMVSWLFRRALVTGLNCPFVAPNRTQAKNIVWDDHVQRVLDELALKGIPYKTNEQELSVKFPNGGKVQLLGVENKNSLRGISNWGAIACDEYDNWDEDIWPKVILPNLITHDATAIIGGTPDGFRNIYRLENSGDFESFHFTSMDNPNLDAEVLEALKNEYKKQGMGAYRQEILAEYEKPEGTVYEEWDMDKQYLPFAYNPSLPLHLSWDFGVNDPTSILFLQPYGSEIRLVDYYEAADANLKHFTTWIAERGYKHAEFEAGDIAGRQRSILTGKSVLSELRDLGHNVRTMPIPDIESQIRHAHKSIPNLYVSKSNPRTARFVECILNYKYPKKAENMINQENENPIHDEFSHAMRAFEYYCWNLTGGAVGGFKQGQQPSEKERISKFWGAGKDAGQQVINLDMFAETSSSSTKPDSYVGGIIKRR